MQKHDGNCWFLSFIRLRSRCRPTSARRTRRTTAPCLHPSSDIASQCSLRSGDMPTALRPTRPNPKSSPTFSSSTRKRQRNKGKASSGWRTSAGAEPPPQARGMKRELPLSVSASFTYSFRLPPRGALRPSPAIAAIALKAQPNRKTCPASMGIFVSQDIQFTVPWEHGGSGSWRTTCS